MAICVTAPPETVIFAVAFEPLPPVSATPPYVPEVPPVPPVIVPSKPIKPVPVLPEPPEVGANAEKHNSGFGNSVAWPKAWVHDKATAKAAMMRDLNFMVSR